MVCVRFVPAAIAAATAAILTCPANACSCTQLTPEEHIKEAGLIADGRVIAVARSHSLGLALDFEAVPFGPNHSARIALGRVWKGTAGTEAVVLTWAYGPGDCGYVFRPQEETILFAHPALDGTFWTDFCLMYPYSDRKRDVFGAELEHYHARWQELRERAEAAPADLSVWLDLALFLEEGNDDLGALHAYRHVAEAAPTRAEGHAGAGRILYAHDRFEEAFTALTLAAGIDAGNHDTLQMLADLRLRFRREANPSAVDFNLLSASKLRFNGADLRNKTFLGAQLQQVSFRGANLDNAQFAAAFLYIVDFSDATLRHADLRLTGLGLNFIGADLSDARAEDADFRSANFVGAVLTRLNAHGARFLSADLSGAICDGADFTGANLRNARLSNARFVGANFASASLERAHLDGADLHDANLRGASLRGAGYDCATRFPPGFDATRAELERLDRNCPSR